MSRDNFDYRKTRYAPKAAFDGGWGSSRRVDPYAPRAMWEPWAIGAVVALAFVGAIVALVQL